MPGSRRVPLLDRAPDEIIACVRGTPVTAATFLAQVDALTPRLPAGDHLINLVQDRYAFTVGFVAALAAGKVNLLPPNAKPAVQIELAEACPGAAVLHDGAAVAEGLDALRLDPERLETAPNPPVDVPDGDATALALIAFTSGSTGRSKPIPKTLAMLRGAAGVYEDSIIPRGARVVATVPAQHMYGLELASLQALWSPIQFTACKPLFPLDVDKELRNVDAPRVLVTTPLHLRALVDSGIAFPALARVICATAPLDAALARRAEDVLGTEVLDVYGCSEAGCIATRPLAREAAWRPLPGVSTELSAEGHAVVHGAHLDAPVPLADQLEPAGDGRFRLTGRLGDLINVAGKRGSLGEITCRLLEVPGVEDGVVFMPPAENGTDSTVQRPAALYTGTARRADIRAHLARSLDAVFIPRPLVHVDHLPRTDTSKLPREAVLELFHRHR